MKEKIKAIEEQIEKLRDERNKRFGKGYRSEKEGRLQRLTLDLIDNVIDDLELRKV